MKYKLMGLALVTSSLMFTGLANAQSETDDEYSEAFELLDRLEYGAAAEFSGNDASLDGSGARLSGKSSAAGGFAGRDPFSACGTLWNSQSVSWNNEDRFFSDQSYVLSASALIFQGSQDNPDSCLRRWQFMDRLDLRAWLFNIRTVDRNDLGILTAFQKEETNAAQISGSIERRLDRRSTRMTLCGIAQTTGYLNGVSTKWTKVVYSEYAIKLNQGPVTPGQGPCDVPVGDLIEVTMNQ